MELNENLWYLIAFFGLFGLCLTTWVVRTVLPNPVVHFYKHIFYPLLHKYLPFTSVHAIVALGFLFVNIVVVLSPTFSPSWETLQSKIALTAVVNIAPLCIGGRAPIVDTLNVSRNWYNRFHSWMGIVVSLETITHSVIAISLRPKSQQMKLSGWVSLLLIVISPLVAIPFIRRCFGKWFLFAHRCISVGGLGALLWHLQGTTSTIAKLLVALSCSFWVATTVLRVCKMIYYRHAAEVVATTHITNACQVEVRVNHEIAVYPGCYFYVYFPIKWYPMRWLKYNFTYSFTALVFWHPSDKDARTAKDLTFLMSRQGSHASAVSQLQTGQAVFLDGPYGQDLRLEGYENVVLAAKGIGIAAILPLALDMAVRRRNDNRIRERMQKVNEQQLHLFDEQQSSKGKGKQKIIERRKKLAEEREQLLGERLYRDAVKKVDVFWSLDHNDQIEWARAQLKYLQSMDPDNKLLIVWCGYPSPINGHPPFKLSRHWMCLECSQSRSFEDIIVSKIKDERARLPGNMVVTVCGDGQFEKTIRRGTVAGMEDRVIQYCESEFHPKSRTSAPDVVVSAGASRLKRKTRRSSSTELRDLTARESQASSYSTMSDQSLTSNYV